MIVDYSTKWLDSGSVQSLSGVDWRLACITTAAVQSFLLNVEVQDKALQHKVRVTDGYRTPQRQAELYKHGLTKTLKSEHLEGMAVDLAYIRAGKAIWSLSWYQLLDRHMQKAALSFGLDAGDLVWGGHWTTLRDGVHWQLMLPPIPNHLRS